MLPGRKYSAEDIARIAMKRAWLIVLTFGLGLASAVGVSTHLPNKFRSETLIMLIPQRISDNYVKAPVTTRIEDRLNSLEDQILSRSRLERIILDLHLYEGLRRTLPMEDVVQRMRDDIGPIKVEGKESFRVSYVSQDAKTAQKTTERLASLFIEENIRDRENVAEDTNQFLDAQLEDAKRRLIEHEKRLEEYRSRYGGELPTQVASNLQAIQNAQVQLQSLADASDRARERRLLLERQLADLQADVTAVVSQQAPSSTDTLPVEGTTEQQLQAARARLEFLLVGKKPDHPDVKKEQRNIRDLEAKLAVENQRPADAPAPKDKPELPAERLRQRRIRDLKLQLEDVDRQLAEKQDQERRLRGTVAEYQAKLDAAPKRESDLIELTRDYTTIQASYQSLLVKREDAKLASNLDRRNIGEQFKVLDPARAPERPFSPNRRLIDLAGGAGGLALGVLLVALFEYRDSSFKTEEDVTRVLNVRVLALIPDMTSSADRQRTRRRLARIGLAVAAVVAVATALALRGLRF